MDDLEKMLVQHELKKGLIPKKVEVHRGGKTFYRTQKVRSDESYKSTSLARVERAFNANTINQMTPGDLKQAREELLAKKPVNEIEGRKLDAVMASINDVLADKGIVNPYEMSAKDYEALRALPDGQKNTLHALRMDKEGKLNILTPGVIRSAKSYLDHYTPRSEGEQVQVDRLKVKLGLLSK